MLPSGPWAHSFLTQAAPEAMLLWARGLLPPVTFPKPSPDRKVPPKKQVTGLSYGPGPYGAEKPSPPQPRPQGRVAESSSWGTACCEPLATGAEQAPHHHQRGEWGLVSPGSGNRVPHSPRPRSWVPLCRARRGAATTSGLEPPAVSPRPQFTSCCPPPALVLCRRHMQTEPPGNGWVTRRGRSA